MSETRIPDAVSWFEGMRLAPYHFQQQDMRTEQLVARMRLAGHPFGWGVIALSTREDAAKKAQVDAAAAPIAIMRDHVEVTALKAIMPDGQYVELEKGATLVFDWKNLGAGRDELLEISLACTRQASSLSDAPPDNEQRAIEVPSRSKGDQPARLHVLRPQLKLVSGVPGGMAAEELLPLFRIRKKNSAGDYARVDYTAPSLSLDAQSPLHFRLQRLAAMLRDGYRNLQTKCDGRAPNMADRPWMLPHLGAHLMELDAHDAGLLVHPYQVYLQLCKLLGVLSALDSRHRVPVAPNFTYRDLDECLAPLIGQIEACLALIAPEYQEVPFTLRGAEGYVVSLSAIPGARQYYVGLEAPNKASAKDMADWIEDATIGQSGQFPALTRLRSEGIDATPVTDETAWRLARPDLVVFQLEGIGWAHAGFKPQDAELRIMPPSGQDNAVVPRHILLLGKATADAAGTAG